MSGAYDLDIKYIPYDGGGAVAAIWPVSRSWRP
jgi:hypothetical protein